MRTSSTARSRSPAPGSRPWSTGPTVRWAQRSTRLRRGRRTLGARPWTIGAAEVAGLPDALEIPTLAALPEALTPLALILPGQLLAEAVAVRRGLSPDAPAGLSKVTLTR